MDWFIKRQVTSCILSAVPAHPDIPKSERPRIIRKAVQLAEVGTLTVEGLKKALAKAESDYLGLPLKQWDVATAILPELPDKRFTRTVEGVRLQFARSWPKHILESRRDRETGIEAPDQVPKRASYIIARVDARSADEAFHRVHRALAVLRGMWHLGMTYQNVRILGGDPFDSLGKVSMARVWSIHSRGIHFPVRDLWLESNAKTPQLVSVSSKDWEKAKSTERRLKQRFKRIAYRRELETALARYAEAMEESQHSWAFVGLWSILEFLTGSAQERNDVTVRRAAFPLGREPLAGILLEHLRHQRNQFVHHDAADVDLRGFAEQTKLFVDTMLTFHLGKGPRLRSVAHVGEFLDLPSEAPVLKERLDLLRQATQFLRLNR